MRCIHHSFLLAAKFKSLFSKCRPKTKNGRQKKRKTNITGFIIDVICQNVHWLNRYLLWLLYAISIISIWPKHSKMAAKNRKANLTGLVINLQSRVMCQNVCFYIGIQIDYMIFMISILPPKSKMSAKDCETNISGFIIDLQSRVICQNLRFLNIGI